MGAEVGSAYWTLSAKTDQLERDMQRAQRTVDQGVEGAAKKADASLKQVEANIAKFSVAATAGFAVLGVAAVKSFADFEFAIDQVGAVAQATDAEMSQLSATALKLGADTAFSATDAARAMEELAAGGRSVAQIIGGEAVAATSLAAAGNYDLAKSANTIATTMDVWKDSTIDTTDVVNRLAGAANTSRFGVDDMSMAIAQGGGVAASAGVSFQDFSTAIAATASSFSSGSDAGTSFKTFVIGLTGNSLEAKAAIRELGLSFSDAQGAMKPMSEIVQQLHDKLGPLSQEMQTTYLKQIFGNDAFRTAAGLMKMTGAEFTTMSNKMGDTDAVDMAAQRMDNLSGDVEKLTGSLETAGIQLGSSFAPAVRAVTQAATGAINAFGGLPPEVQRNTLVLGAMAAAFPAVVSGIGKANAALKGLGLMMDTTRGKAMLLGTGFLAAFAGIDILVGATTGQGLISRISKLFSEADLAVEGATEAIREFDLAMRAAGSGADPLAEGTLLIAQRSREFTEAMEASGSFMTEFRGQTIQTGAAQKILAGEVAGVINSMIEQGAAAEDVLGIYNDLDPALQDLVRNQIDLAAIQADSAGAMRDAATAGHGYQAMMADLELETANGGRTEEELNDAIHGMGEVLGPTTEQLGIFSGDIRAFFAGLSDDEFQDFTDNVIEDFDDLKEAIGGLLPTTQEAFDDWRNQMTLMTQDHQNFKTNLTTIYQGIVDAGIENGEAILAAVADQGPGYAAMFAKWYAEDPTKAMEAAAMLIPIAAGEMTAGVVNEVLGIPDGANTAMSLFHENMVRGMNEAEAAATIEAYNLAVGVITELEDEMVGRVQKANPIVGAEIAAIPTDATPALVSGMGTAGSEGGAAFETALVAAINVAGAAAGAAARAAADAVRREFAPSAFQNAGTEAWAGTSSGMTTAATQGAPAAGKKIADTTVKGLQDGFYIDSPSKLTHDEVGVPAGEGVITGAIDGAERALGQLAAIPEMVTDALVGPMESAAAAMLTEWDAGARNLVSITQWMVEQTGGDFFEMEAIVQQFAGEFANGQITVHDAASNIAGSFESVGEAATEGLGQLPSMLQQWADGSRNLVSITQWMTDEVDGNFFEVERAVQDFAGAFINGEMDVAEASRGILSAVDSMTVEASQSVDTMGMNVEATMQTMLTGWADGTNNLVSLTNTLVAELGIDFFAAEAIVQEFAGQWANGQITISEAAAAIASSVAGMSDSVVKDIGKATSALTGWAAAKAAAGGISSNDPSDPLNLHGNGISELQGPNLGAEKYMTSIMGKDYEVRYSPYGDAYIKTGNGWINDSSLGLTYGGGTQDDPGPRTIEDLLNSQAIRSVGMLPPQDSGSGGSGATINVYAAPGMDETQVATVVKQKLDAELEDQFGYGARQWGR